MSQMLKKFIGNNQVDQDKIRLDNNANLRARNAADSGDISILKVNSSDRIEFASLPQVTSDPSAANDIVRKSYVDAVLQGLKPKEAVRAATTANVNLASELENGDIIDGVTLVTGDRVLVKDQTLQENNGIYIVQASGAAVRSTDFDSLTPIDEINGAYTFVREGSANQGKGFVVADAVATLGTDPIVFVFFNSVANLTGGDGITITGNTIDVDLAGLSGLEFATGELQINLEASNPSLEINGSNELAVKLNTSAGLSSGASGVQIDLVALSGLEFSSGDLSINLEASNPTLEVNGSNELKVKFDTAQGLAQGANGLEIDLAAAGGLEFSAGDIAINVDSTNGTSKINASNELEVVKQVEQQITLAGGDITNQYIDLSFTARAVDCIALVVLGGILQERGVDYTVSLSGGVAGVTRITFSGDLATGGAAELVAGDKLVVSYEHL